MADDERFIAIEIKLAHQEDLVQSLSEVIDRQQRQIRELEQRLRGAIERISARDEPAIGQADERPPHY